MKKHFTNSLSVLVNLNAGMWLGMLIADMAIPLVVRLFLHSELVDRIVRVLGFFIVIMAVLFYRAYKSYRKAGLTHGLECWKISDIMIVVCIALAIQFCISVVFSFAMYVTGAGYYLGWLFYNVDKPILSVKDVPTVYYICGTLLTYPFYVLSVVLGSKSGFDSAQSNTCVEN